MLILSCGQGASKQTLLSLSVPTCNMEKTVFAALIKPIRERQGATQTTSAWSTVNVQFNSATVFLKSQLNEIYT